MKKKRFLILAIVLALVAVAGVASHFLLPGQQENMAFSQMPPDMPEGEMPQMPEGEMPEGMELPGGQMPRQEKAGSCWWLVVSIAACIGALVCLGLYRHGAPKPEETPENSMPVLETDEDTPQRDGGGANWVTVCCIILAIALLVSSLPSGISANSTVNARVLSGQMEDRTLSSSLSGAGTLAAQQGHVISIPQSLEVEYYCVQNGQSVAVGDPIAAVNKTQVASAIRQLQQVLAELDEDLNEAAGDSPSTGIKTRTSGRVKKIYAQSGDNVADVVYENGGLILLSLDGLMAVDIPAELEMDAPVTVRLPDGTCLDGTVSHVADGVSTVTMPDETIAPEDMVTVLNAEGETLGSGAAYVHSALKISGTYGTVSTVHVKQDQKVSAGTNLITLKDTGHTARYSYLLDLRQELEEQMDTLVQLSRDGILYAEYAGRISGVDTTVDYQPAAAETRQRSQASPGYTPVGGIRMEGSGSSEEGDGESVPPESTEPTETEPTQPTQPVQPQGKSYALGVVLAVQDGAVLYVTKGTYTAAEGESFPSPTASQEDMARAQVLPEGLTVLLSSGSSWDASAYEAIAQGDALLIGEDRVIHQHASAGQFPGMGGMGGMDISGLLGGASAMTGAFSGMGGGTVATPGYETYDTSGQDVVTITPDEEMTVEFSVDELDILSLRTGMEVSVTLDALPGQSFRGSITKVGCYGENQGGNTKYTVTVTLPRSEKMLVGMNASVKIVTSTSSQVATIPAAAIQFDAGASWVYTGYDEKKDTLTGKVQVETGLSDGQNVQILSGLEPGDTFYYRYADSIEYSFVG